MGAAGFWSDRVLEPKRKSRFILQLGDMDHWVVKTSRKPSFEINVTEHTYLNHKFYYPGTVSWNAIDVTLVDPLTPDATWTMYKILMASGYNPPLDQNRAESSLLSKRNAANALQMVRLIQLGPGGVNDQIEQWDLKNAFISKVDFGELDYSADDLVDITITLTYDFAVMTDVHGEAAGTF